MVPLGDLDIGHADVHRIRRGMGMQADLVQGVVGPEVPINQPLQAGSARGGRSDHVHDGNDEALQTLRVELEGLTQCQGAIHGHPELVRVGVQHPIRLVQQERIARHGRDHRMLLFAVHRVFAQVDQAAVREPAQDLQRPVDGTVVGDNDLVDTLVEVVRQHRPDHVRFVPDHQGHYKPHW